MQMVAADNIDDIVSRL